MVSRSLRTRRAISASSIHRIVGRTESGGKGLMGAPLNEATILHAASEPQQIRRIWWRHQRLVITGAATYQPGTRVFAKRIPGVKPARLAYPSNLAASFAK